MMKSVVGSSGGGITDAAGSRKWPFSSKKERNPSRSSAVVRTRSILGALLGGARAPAERFLLELDLLADLLERAPDQPRHVHLRDPDPLRDLRLRQALEEAEVEDRPLALVERLETRLEHGPLLRDLVARLLRADRLHRIDVFVAVEPDARRERERAICAAALERLEHLLLLGARGVRELRDRRRAPELDGQLLDD